MSATTSQLALSRHWIDLAMLTRTQHLALRSTQTHLRARLHQPPARAHDMTHDAHRGPTGRWAQVHAVERPADARILPEALLCNGGDDGARAHVKDERRRAAVQVVHPVAQRLRHVQREDGRALRAGRVDARRHGRHVRVQSLVKVLYGRTQHPDHARSKRCNTGCSTGGAYRTHIFVAVHKHVPEKLDALERVGHVQIERHACSCLPVAPAEGTQRNRSTVART